MNYKPFNKEINKQFKKQKTEITKSQYRLAVTPNCLRNIGSSVTKVCKHNMIFPTEELKETKDSTLEFVKRVSMESKERYKWQQSRLNRLMDSIQNKKESYDIKINNSKQIKNPIKRNIPILNSFKTYANNNSKSMNEIKYSNIEAGLAKKREERLKPINIKDLTKHAEKYKDFVKKMNEKRRIDQ